MKIVGIAGLPRSGKDTLAELYIKYGYYGVSLGDIVRNESRQRHFDKDDPISVANMTETSNYLRSQYGADIVLKKAIQNYERASTARNYQGLVIYSVRTPVEVDFVLQSGGQLIWVEASNDVRYARAIKFTRDGEMQDIDMDTFLKHEALQWRPKPGISKEVQMDVSYVKQNATIVVDNNGSIQDLNSTFQTLV